MRTWRENEDMERMRKWRENEEIADSIDGICRECSENPNIRMLRK